MRYLPLLVMLCACSDPSWCSVTYYFTPPDSGWARPDSVDLSDPDATAVEADSVTAEPCTE